MLSRPLRQVGCELTSFSFNSSRIRALPPLFTIPATITTPPSQFQTRNIFCSSHQKLERHRNNESSAISTRGYSRMCKLESEYQCDVAIIGGGAIGSSAAYHIKQHPEGKDLDVIVLDRDLNYSRSSTVLSVGSIRQQFSAPENIQLSMSSFPFLENVKNHLTVAFDDQPVDICFKKSGYLFLATKDGMDTLHRNNATQMRNGAKIKLHSSTSLKEVYPWLNASDLAGGSLGTDNEGWFDPWSYLCALRKKNESLGVKYLQANIAGFPNVEETVFDQLAIREASVGDPAYPSASPLSIIRSKMWVNACGAWSGNLCRLLGIGGRMEDGSSVDSLSEEWRDHPMMQYPLPIVPRKRYVYVFHCANGPELENCPMVVDPSGVYFRREGPSGYFICGRTPDPEDEPDAMNLEVDYDYFDEKIWPILAHRVPAFENLKVTHAWAGYYDYNVLDQNGVVGYHPLYENFVIAAGFSGHGIQMSPAVGRSVSELVCDNKFKTINLDRFGFERFAEDKLVFEVNVV